MAATTAFRRAFQTRDRHAADPFYGENAKVVEPKPPREDRQQACPYCDQWLDDQSLGDDRWGIIDLFVGGVHRLQVAVWMLARAAFRFLRFVVAAVLCLAGLVGDLFRGLGLRIAHPQDRRLLRRSH